MADADLGSPHEDLGSYVLGWLNPQERAQFERHLAGCASCQHELEELRGMPDLLARAAEPVEVPSGMGSRVLDAIAREPQAVPLRLSRPRPRRASAWRLAAAAVVAIAFLAGFGLGRWFPGGGAQPAPVAQTINLVAVNGGRGSAVATIRQATGGKVIELSVRDLAPAPPGSFYTCWLVADDDTLQHQDRVSVGSFTTARDGTATVRWETAADLGRYPHLGVTLEPDNGNPLHQGPKVLTTSA